MVKPIKVVFDEEFYSMVGEHPYNEVMEMEQEITNAIMEKIDSGDITHDDADDDGNIVIGSPTIIYDDDGDLEEVTTQLRDVNDEDDLFGNYELINGTVH